jgi:hypothetical protein
MSLVIMGFWNKLKFIFKHFNYYFSNNLLSYMIMGLYIYILKVPKFPWNKYIMLLTTIGQGGDDTHSMSIFFELFNIVHENNFKTKV